MIHLVKVWLGTSTLIMLVIWTNDGQPPHMYLLLLEGQLVKSLHYNLQLHCQPQRPSTWILQRLLKRLFGFKTCLKTWDWYRSTLMCIATINDSQNAIHLVKNQVYHTCTKHIDVRFHFVQEIVNEWKILLQKIKTVENPANMLTKVVTTIKFQHCLNLINIP